MKKLKEFLFALYSMGFEDTEMRMNKAGMIMFIFRRETAERDMDEVSVIFNVRDDQAYAEVHIHDQDKQYIKAAGQEQVKKQIINTLTTNKETK